MSVVQPLVVYVETLLAERGPEALVVGAIWMGWAMLNFIQNARERKRAEERHQELLAKMESMVGKSVEEQRQIVNTVKETYKTTLTRPDGITEIRSSDESTK